MADRVIIVGGGGHALSVAQAALRAGYRVVGCVAPDICDRTRTQLAWLGGDAALADSDYRGIDLLNGIGSAGAIELRRARYLALRNAGHHFASLLDPDASLGLLGVSLGAATQLLARSVVNAGCSLGDNVLINTAAVIEHGCRVGSHSHVASGAVVCGDCDIGESVHIGAGATLIQGIEVGSGSVIAAGAVVTRKVEPLTLVAGVPARVIRRSDE